MRNLTAKILIALTALVTVAAAAPPASADQTWTVGPGADGAEIDFDGMASSVPLFDNDTQVLFFTCQTSELTGDAFAGPDQPGTGIVRIDSMDFTYCIGGGGIAYTISTGAFPWQFNAESFSDGVATGPISGINLWLSGPLCHADIDGAGGAGSGTGEVAGTYDDSTHQLVISGGNLTIRDVVGCFGLLQDGDSVTFNGAYMLSPGITITRP